MPYLPKLIFTETHADPIVLLELFGLFNDEKIQLKKEHYNSFLMVADKAENIYYDLRGVTELSGKFLETYLLEMESSDNSLKMI